MKNNNITWAKIVFWLKYPHLKPFGLVISYEFRPSTSYYIGQYDVHPEYYKLTPKEYDKAKERALHRLHTNIDKAQTTNPALFFWQQFKITNASGETIILQMNREGRVIQLKEIEVMQKFLVAA